MAKWQRLAGGKDYGNTDYKDMCENFSNITGAGIRYERKGDFITLYTDGDPVEVMETLILFGVLFAISEELADFTKEMKFEKNARMN